MHTISCSIFFDAYSLFLLLKNSFDLINIVLYLDISKRTSRKKLAKKREVDEILVLYNEKCSTKRSISFFRKRLLLLLKNCFDFVNVAFRTNVFRE